MDDLPATAGKEQAKAVQCEVSEIWHTLGKAWALIILKNMSTKEPIRFNDLRRALPGISSTVLSDRLKEMEKEGLITKRIFAEVPLRVEYSLTRQAKELEQILGDLWKWAGKWNPDKSNTQKIRKI